MPENIEHGPALDRVVEPAAARSALPHLVVIRAGLFWVAFSPTELQHPDRDEFKVARVGLTKRHAARRCLTGIGKRDS